MGDTQDSLNILFTLTKIFVVFPATIKKISGNREICFSWMSFKTICAVTIIFVESVDIVLYVYAGIQQDVNSIQIGEL